MTGWLGRLVAAVVSMARALSRGLARLLHGRRITRGAHARTSPRNLAPPIPIDRVATPSITIGADLKGDGVANDRPSRGSFSTPALLRVPTVAGRLQLRAAAAFFLRFDISVIPWPVAEALRRYDAPYALAAFVRGLGLDIDILLDPVQEGHSDAADRLRLLCEILVAGESAAHGTALSLTPLIEAASADVGAAETVLDALSLAAQVWRTTEECGLDWAVYARFRADTQAALHEWASLEAGALAELYIDAVAYQRLQEHAELAFSRIEVALARLSALARGGHAEAGALESRVRTSLRDLERDLRNKLDVDAHVVIEALFLLDADLRQALGEQPEEPSEGETTEAELARLLAVLDLPPGTNVAALTARCRRLRNELHPDRHPSHTRETAERRLMEVNAAYARLMILLTSTAGAP